MAGPVGNYVLLFESTDGIEWTYRRTLISAGTGARVGLHYLSITASSAGAWSHGIVGQTFFVYAVYTHVEVKNKQRVYRSTVYLDPSDCHGACGPPQLGSGGA